ncbi:glycoside hydrolase family 88 protein [Meiothermus sp.]|uniref:glycoside hydrolase family 88 protein n=1 Tax=Meiothermus sp. TaxID=1955249 RepID=UPI00307CFEA9
MFPTHIQPELKAQETAAQAEAAQLENPALGLQAIQLGEQPVQLRFAKPSVSGAARPLLRLVNSKDCRRTALIRVFYQDRLVRQLDVRIPAQWASFILDLTKVLGQNADAWPEVLELAIAAQENPVGLVESLQPGPLPKLLVGGGQQFVPTSAWVAVPVGAVSPLQRMLGDFLHSRAATDYLGWMIGCTTTGLSDLYRATGNESYRQALQRMLAGVGEGLPLEGMKRRGEGTVEEPGYIDLLNQRLESFAPVAALAHLQRTQPTPERAGVLRILGQRMIETARITRDFLTSEGCFTLAFPLAATATALDETDWFDIAWQECARRWDFLWRGAQVIQRAYSDGRVAMVNWARGTAWLVLGTAQVVLQLPPEHPGRDELISRLVRITPLLLQRQQPDGLWPVFTDRPDLPAETSGSAGIAAGLALGAKAGWLGGEALQAAQRCGEALESFIEPDGCLGGVSQHNPAGEVALQERYRIRAAWGVGLYAQLIAALV